MARSSLIQRINLGEAKVLERLRYDHVGIRKSTNLNDVSGISERIAKARKTLNAATGLGIRRNGLTIATCNIIFWSLVVPIALYGCEVSHLSNGEISILENFQTYAAKKIQRFYERVPNLVSLYALGWMRLEHFVQVKMMMFIRSVLVLDDQTLSRRIFCERATVIFERDIVDGDETGYNVVHDLLVTASLFNLLNEVRDMVLRGQHYPKSAWKGMVWSRAWELEDVFWNIQFQALQSLDLIRNVNLNCSYLTWWYLSDKVPTAMKRCETLAHLVREGLLTM